MTELRMCDKCGKITEAGEFPDWPNGMCEECDPPPIPATCPHCGRENTDNTLGLYPPYRKAAFPHRAFAHDDYRTLLCDGERYLKW